MKRTMTYLAAGAALILVVAAVLLFTPAGEGPLDRLFAVGDLEPFDFANPDLADEPNQFLMCPPDFCGANPHAQSPVLPISVEALSQRWRDLAAGQPRVTLLAEGEDGMQLDYVQRSARLRFPDIISVRFISLAPAESTLAIYSRSIYGKSDFGVNRERVTRWLGLLAQEGP